MESLIQALNRTSALGPVWVGGFMPSLRLAQPMAAYEFLKQVPLFAEMPEKDLEALCETIDEVRLANGVELFAEGDEGDRAYVIQQGELEIHKQSGEQDVLLAVRGPGEVIGEVALLEEARRMAGARARGDTWLLAISKQALDDLLNSSPSAAKAMFDTILARWRATEARVRQSEKMAQLGTLSAGVAHELNNPAAAVKRSADQLTEALDHHIDLQQRLAQTELSADQQYVLVSLTSHAKQKARTPPEMDALARADREEDLEDWLEECGVPEPWDLAPTLVDLAIDEDMLQELQDRFNAEELTLVIHWLGAMHTTHALLHQVAKGAGRISGIVKALKSYSFLDQAPVQEVDVHEGLDDTLMMLRAKLKQGISVRREYAPDLPTIEAHGSELNQVWTNLLDNAADAVAERMEDGGVEEGIITLRTHREPGWIVVEVEDNGGGMPPEVRERIFDQFYTTKAPGKGTGLGLHISHGIVTEQHGGGIRVHSRPGRTVFRVQLPSGDSEDDEVGDEDAALQPPDTVLRAIYERTRTIAVVGMSGDPEKPSCRIPMYLQRAGYRVIPVNPRLAEVAGERAYPDIVTASKAVDEPIDVALMFRPGEEMAQHIDAVLEVGVSTLWMQAGIVNEGCAAVARAAGVDVVQDLCMMVTHKRLFPDRIPE